MSPPDEPLGPVSDDQAERAFVEEVMALSPRQKVRFLELLTDLLTAPVQANASTGSTAEISPEDLMRRESHRWA